MTLADKFIKDLTNTASTRLISSIEQVAVNGNQESIDIFINELTKHVHRMDILPESAGDFLDHHVPEYYDQFVEFIYA